MSSSLNPNSNFQRSVLPQSIILPPELEDLPWYMMQLYQTIATAVNERDYIYFEMAISATPTIIPYMNNTGSYILCVSGAEPLKESTGNSFWPAATFSITKSTPTLSGVESELSVDKGEGGSLQDKKWDISYITKPGESVANTYAAIFHNGPANLIAKARIKIIGTF